MIEDDSLRAEVEANPCLVMEVLLINLGQPSKNIYNKVLNNMSGENKAYQLNLLL